MAPPPPPSLEVLARDLLASLGTATTSSALLPLTESFFQLIREASFAEVMSCEALLAECLAGLLNKVNGATAEDEGAEDEGRNKAAEALLVGAMPLVRGLPGPLVSELSLLAIASLSSPALATQALHAVQCITTMRPAFSRAPALLETALGLPVPSFDAPMAPVAMEVVAAAARAALEESEDPGAAGLALSAEDKAAMTPLVDTLASSGLTALLVSALAASGSDPAAREQGNNVDDEDDRLAEAITSEGLNLLGLEVGLSRVLGTAEAHAGLVGRVIRAYAGALTALDSRPVETDLALIKTSRRLVKYLALCVGEARPEAVSPHADAAYRAVYSLTRGVRSRMADPEAGRVRKAHKQAYDKLRQSAVACVCALFQAAPAADFAAARDQDFWRLAKTLADPVAIAEFAALMARAGTPERAREAANKVAGYLCAGCGEGKGATRGLVMEAAARLVSGPAGELVDVALLAQLCEAVVAECSRDPVAVGRSGFPAALTMLASLPPGAYSDSLPGDLGKALSRVSEEESQGLGGAGPSRDGDVDVDEDEEMEEDGEALTEALSSAFRFFARESAPGNAEALEPVAVALLRAATRNTSREVVFDDEAPLRCLEAEAVPSLLKCIKPEAHQEKIKEMAEIWKKQPQWDGDRQAQVNQAIKAMEELNV